DFDVDFKPLKSKPPKPNSLTSPPTQQTKKQKKAPQSSQKTGHPAGRFPYPAKPPTTITPAYAGKYRIRPSPPGA
ncbi:hypothetical protein, partial [Cupriavidus sp. WS]|uniref:hypothetical protein n=1 Tax=Cupriavidus sp. WS TaxID=1312922 RepID=UPI001E5D54FC